MDNFNRTIHEAQVENRFDPDAIQWEKISQAFMRNPDRTLKNADKRMGFQFNNMFIVKCFFTFGLRKVEPGMIHLIQTTNVPVLICELPPSSRRSQVEPNLYRRSFEPYDQMLYHRTVMEPHPRYPIPAGTQYILMTVQKTVFALDVLPETILTTLLQNGFRLGDFQKAKHYHQKAYKLPPPTPAHTPIEERPASGKRALAKNYLEVPSRYKKMRIAQATRRIQRPPTPEPATSVFVPPPAPVVVAPPAPVVVAPPAPVTVSPPAPVKERNIFHSFIMEENNNSDFESELQYSGESSTSHSGQSSNNQLHVKSRDRKNKKRSRSPENDWNKPCKNKDTSERMNIQKTNDAKDDDKRNENQPYEVLNTAQMPNPLHQRMAVTISPTPTMMHQPPIYKGPYPPYAFGPQENFIDHNQGNYAMMPMLSQSPINNALPIPTSSVEISPNVCGTPVSNG
ncbi:uncharacterized protein NPIL_605421, partial [Nephila pilipes]